ncbi:MAG: hypothetical protein ACOYXT_09265 [Bacteroidota bacterium]
MIILECYADEHLVRALGATSKGIKHAFSKGEVCNLLRKSVDTVGIIDEDPGAGKPEYERRLLNNRILENDKIIVCEDRKLRNRLILIRPKLENFVIKLAEENKIEVSDFNLSPDPGKLHDELAFKRNLQKLNSFEKLIAELERVEDTIPSIKKFIGL